eukprot:11312692-Alexandrium_andersonii.AAC.1
MSASLVGSEMCIRDSLGTLRKRPPSDIEWRSECSKLSQRAHGARHPCSCLLYTSDAADDM